MKVTSRQTYRLVRWMLEHPEFKQLRASKETGVAFSRVNKVVNWLVDVGYAARIANGYRLVSPVALLGLFRLNRSMGKLRTSTFEVQAERKELDGLIQKTDSVYCLTSALSRYDTYFRDPSIHVYAGKELADELLKFPRGLARLDLYRDDLGAPEDVIHSGSGDYTSEMRTIIDVICSDRSYAAERLIKKKWSK